MLVKIELLILIKDCQAVTAYFFDRENKILLPIQFTNWVFCTGKTTSKEPQNIGFVILWFENNLAELNLLNQENNVTKATISLQEGLIFAQQNDIPIFTHQNFIEKQGMVITRKFIEEILLC